MWNVTAALRDDLSHLFWNNWFYSPNPLKDTWQNCLPPPCCPVGQSCTLIRLGSTGANHPSLSPFSSTLSLPRGPPCGSRRWASPGGTPTSSGSPACCLLGNQQGGVLIITKHLSPSCQLEVGLCGAYRDIQRMTCGGQRGGPGPSCRVKWGERICRAPLWRAGGQSQGNARQTDVGFCSCMASSTLSIPWATAGSLNSAACVQFTSVYVS